MENTEFHNTFLIKENIDFALEVTNGADVEHSPFSKITSGAFVVTLSSDLPTIEDVLKKEGIQAEIGGFRAAVPFRQNSELLMYSDHHKHVSHGSLDYRLTPFFDQSANSLTVYYHHGSNYKTGSKYRSSELKISCDSTMNTPTTFYGTEPQGARYCFEAKSSGLCELLQKL